MPHSAVNPWALAADNAAMRPLVITFILAALVAAALLVAAPLFA